MDTDNAVERSHMFESLTPSSRWTALHLAAHHGFGEAAMAELTAWIFGQHDIHMA